MKYYLWLGFLGLFGFAQSGFAYVPDVGEGKCVYNCNVPSYSGSSNSYNAAAYNAMGQATHAVFNQIGQGLVNAWTQAAVAQAQAQAEARQRKQRALRSNDQGNVYFAQGQWDQAIAAYESALRYSPYDRVIQKNLTNAKVSRLVEKGEQAHRAGRWQEAQDYYDRALQVDPANRKARKSLRLARAMRSREAAEQEEAELISLMSESYQEMQTKIRDLNADLAEKRLSADERAAFLNQLQQLQEGKGVRFRDDIPLPIPAEKVPPYQAPLLEGKGDALLNLVIEAANKTMPVLDKAGDWAGEQYRDIKNMLQGEVQNRLPGGKVKEIQEDIDDLKKKIGGEHEKTVTGLFDHMEQGAKEAASPGIGGHTDERIDRFIQDRGEGYQAMAEDEIHSRVKDVIRQIPEGTPDVAYDPKSTTSPILGKKSYAVERAAQLNSGN